MNDLISIVVPVYNSEKYLKKCVDSLLDQNYYSHQLSDRVTPNLDYSNFIL